MPVASVPPFQRWGATIVDLSQIAMMEVGPTSVRLFARHANAQGPSGMSPFLPFASLTGDDFTAFNAWAAKVAGAPAPPAAT